MTKSIKELAKELNAEIYEENHDEIGTGILIRNFKPSDYDETLSLNSDGTHYYSHVESSEEDSEEFNSWVCTVDHHIESQVDFENGEAVSTSYCFVTNNSAGQSFDDDVDGVLDFWRE